MVCRQSAAQLVRSDSGALRRLSIRMGRMGWTRFGSPCCDAEAVNRLRELIDQERGMLISLIQTWLDTTLFEPAAKDALKMFQDSFRERVIGTLVVGTALTRRHNSYMARSDGLELTVHELTP